MQVRILPGALLKCSKCELEKPEEEFSWKNKSKGKRSSNCRECSRAAIRNHYSENRDYYYAKNKRRAADLRAYVEKIKEGPCMDCGKTFPSRAMDFHHRGGDDKLNNISQLWNCGSKKRLDAELAKCDLLCAVCHRLRH